jgi:hypothetical protein
MPVVAVAVAVDHLHQPLFDIADVVGGDVSPPSHPVVSGVFQVLATRAASRNRVRLTFGHQIKSRCSLIHCCEDVPQSADDLSTTMNALGNCCLLEKSFNVSKGAEPLSTS